MATPLWPHFVSGSCAGERCAVCGAPATHKVGEEIALDDPLPCRHNLTAYVCCPHFVLIFGPLAPCLPREVKKEAPDDR